MSPRFDPDRTDLMTVEQVAAYLQLNKLTVYRYIREGRIPAARLGKAYRIRKSDVDAFLESQTLRHPAQAAPRTRTAARSGSRRATRRAGKESEEIAVAPRPRATPEGHPDVPINPMEWVIRGLH